ncbi:MAG: tyrosine-type recombinase/integrase, partial [Coriobacteriia bacterium]
KPQRVISGITLKDVESFLVYLKQKVVKGYVVYFRNLKAAFNKAKDWGYVKENYFTKIKLPKRQRVQPAYIDSRQLEEICRQFTIGNKQLAIGSRQIENDVVRDVVVIGFYTGMRLNEIVNLKWKNVDLNNKIITVGDEEFTTKGKEQRFIPICDEAMEVLFRREKTEVRSQNKSSNVLVHHLCVDGNSNYVFCKSKGVKFTGDYFSKRFKSACLKAGIDKSIHFHSLRHSFASNLVQKGVSLYKIKELLGHSSISTTEIYSHLNLDSLRDAIKTLDDSPEHLTMISTSSNREFISSERNSLSHLRIFSLKG